MRKTVSYLMSLKAEVSDKQAELHQAGETLEEICFSISQCTTEEIRCGCGLKDMIRNLKDARADVTKQLKSLEEAVKTLREFF
jgi:hypothetical protein